MKFEKYTIILLATIFIIFVAVYADSFSTFFKWTITTILAALPIIGICDAWDKG